ncbi:MAG: asparaginase [Rhizobiaceae bacterium]|nr:asparaginase [Rhizobiaceae bacterium]MCV0405544.1 asparaginase [Rhizobiaceae bacterium]
MTDPVLVQVLRGNIVESEHRGAVAVSDADGAVVLSLGDIDKPVFPRSAVKAIQALPFVESGAADAYGFGEAEIALACASHSGEDRHLETARSMLAAAGLDEAALECGPHWPARQEVLIDRAARGQTPTRLWNNCSGKHSGFLCGCRHIGLDHRGYVGPDHPYQRLIAETMTQVTGAAHDRTNAATDGCSIPTYAVPLRSLALGFARMATGQRLSAERAKAARRVLGACMAEPFMVAGTGRACTKLMEAAPGRIFAKTGAEGVFCAALPEAGLGIAVKCDDGAGRAAEAIVAAVLARFLGDDPELSARLRGLTAPPIHNWAGEMVGRIDVLAIAP